MKKVVVGMSGGVDSSVACFLLKQQGYKVIGITFKMLPNFDSSDAEKVAKYLGIEFHVVDIEEDFKKTIIDNFINSYKLGLTPNPCVLCNRKIKFKYLEEQRQKYNADFVATGHYARIIDGKICESSDLNKDQTYFLSNIDKNVISHILFPLEGINKDEVRKLAEDNNLITAHKKDSYDVCFITNKFKDFIKTQVSMNSGEVINVETNEKVGTHKGLMNYTIGQRRGLDIGGNSDRMFVVGKDIDKNILYVCIGEENDYLVSTSCLVTDYNSLIDEKVSECTAKFRYRQEKIPVIIEHKSQNEVLVKYRDGCKRVTPGQTCTLYKDNICLGGGTIKEVYKNDKKMWYL